MGYSAIFFTQTHVVTYYDILLIIISTVRGEAMLFLAECYLEKIAHFRYLSFILYTKEPYDA